MNNNFYSSSNSSSNQRRDTHSQNRNVDTYNQQIPNSYVQNNNYSNDNYGYNSSNQNSGYKQNNRCTGNSGYSDNGYGNDYNNPRGYNNYHPFINDSAPPGAEVIYKNERQGVKAGKIIMGIYVVLFVIFAGYVVFCNDPTINTVLVEKIVPIGVLLFMSGILLYITFQPTVNTIIKKPRCTQQVTAQIVDVKTTRGNNGNRNYYPTYQYYYKGKIYVVKASKNMSLTRPYVGQEIKMTVNPNNPTEYYIDTTLINIISLVFGSIFFIMLLNFLVPTIFS